MNITTNYYAVLSSLNFLQFGHFVFLGPVCEEKVAADVDDFFLLFFLFVFHIDFYSIFSNSEFILKEKKKKKYATLNKKKHISFFVKM